MKKLRLLVTADCNRTCKGCCNKDWDLDQLPVCNSMAGFDEVYLTGGEPLLYPDKIRELLLRAGAVDVPLVYLYTASSSLLVENAQLLGLLDGVTLTLHTRKDVPLFAEMMKNQRIKDLLLDDKSNRLNVFRGISLAGIDTTGWQVKSGITWIKDCPLPKDEVFMKAFA